MKDIKLFFGTIFSCTLFYYYG